MSKLSPRKLTYLLIAAGVLCRLVLGFSIGLGIDESYAVSISRSISLSYFDHPPLHFWLLRLAAMVTGSEMGWVLRLPFILLFAGTTWLMFRITARCFGEAAGFYAALLLNVSAVFSLSTGSWILPDGPLMFFLLASLDVFLGLIFFKQTKSWPWILAGFFLGLGIAQQISCRFFAGRGGNFSANYRPSRIIIDPRTLSGCLDSRIGVPSCVDLES